MDQGSVQLFDLQVDHTGTQYLAQAAKWGRFLSLIGFVFVALMAVFSLFAGTLFSKTMTSLSGMGGSGTVELSTAFNWVISFFYLLIAALWFMPVLYIYRFSTKMQAALRSNDQQLLNDSFKNLKSCFRFMGIMTIIGLSFYVLAIIIGLGTLIAGS